MLTWIISTIICYYIIDFYKEYRETKRECDERQNNFLKEMELNKKIKNKIIKNIMLRCLYFHP